MLDLPLHNLYLHRLKSHLNIVKETEDVFEKKNQHKKKRKLKIKPASLFKFLRLRSITSFISIS
jgi:hypothetical protein